MVTDCYSAMCTNFCFHFLRSFFFYSFKKICLIFSDSSSFSCMLCRESSSHKVTIMKKSPFSHWSCCFEHRRDLITSVLFPLSHWNLEGQILIATSNSSSVHQTFLIKFQVNWLRSNVPEVEWQSRSKDDPQLFVCEPKQQEKGNFHLLLFSFEFNTSHSCVRCFFLLLTVELIQCAKSNTY